MNNSMVHEIKIKEGSCNSLQSARVPDVQPVAAHTSDIVCCSQMLRNRFRAFVLPGLTQIGTFGNSLDV